MMVTVQRILDLARQELGTTEQPAGSNRVKYNTDYYGREVSGSSYPWCCVFVWWLFRRAGAEELFYGGGKTAYCPTLLNYYKQHGQIVSDYKPGDIVFFNFSGGTGAAHVGILEQDHGQTVTTIDGNTGSGNEANGGAVQRRTRNKKYIVGAARPAYAAEEEAMTQEQFDKMMEDWLKRQEQEEPADWSEPERKWAEENGLIYGDGSGRKMYKSFATREHMIVFLYRLAEKLGLVK